MVFTQSKWSNVLLKFVVLAEAATSVSQLSACVPPFYRRRLAIFIKCQQHVRRTASHLARQQRAPSQRASQLLWVIPLSFWNELRYLLYYTILYYKYGSYFQCFCATVFEKLSHPKSEARHCLLAEHSTVSLSDVVFVPSISIIQSDNAPKWRTCRGHHRPEVWVSQTCGSFHFGGHL